MSDTNENGTLHLPNLEISGFRGISSLSIPHLGHVTLLAGRNSVGKTTVLEAMQVYAARARHSVLQAVLNRRGEFEIPGETEPSFSAWGQTAPARVYEYANLFYGRNLNASSLITIGPKEKINALQITACSWDEASEMHQGFVSGFRNTIIEDIEDIDFPFLKVLFQNEEMRFPRIMAENMDNVPDTIRKYSTDDRWPSSLECVLLGPELPGKNVIARYWENVALTDYQEFCLESLRLVLGEDSYVEGIATIGDRGRSRNTVVKLRGSSQRVPLASLGDGAMRMFGLALSLANSRNGFLLIDEAENGIHHSLQEDYWYMVLEAALKGNIQVIATTHSWDCVDGFAQAAARSDAEGVLVRLEREEDRIGVVEYSEEGLGIVTKRGIEVR